MKTLFKIAAPNKTLPIIRDYILFDGDTARATDLEIHAVITGDWYFIQPTLIPITSIKIALALSKKPVWAGNTLNGINLITDNVPDISEYPLLPDFTGEQLELAPDFMDKFKQVLPIMAKKDVRYYLNGVCLNLTFGSIVTTDGHRLHLTENVFLPIHLQKTINNMDHAINEVIIPRAVFDLKLDVTGIAVSSTHSKIYHKDGFIVVKNIDGKFPDYNRVIPSNGDRPVKKQFNGAQTDTLKRLAAVHKANKSKFDAIRIDESGNASACNIELPLFDSMPFNYGINVNYLLDSFQAADYGTISFNSGNDSALIRNGDFTAIVMSTRI